MEGPLIVSGLPGSVEPGEESEGGGLGWTMGGSMTQTKPVHGERAPVDAYGVRMKPASIGACCCTVFSRKLLSAARSCDAYALKPTQGGGEC